MQNRSKANINYISKMQNQLQNKINNNNTNNRKYFKTPSPPKDINDTNEGATEYKHKIRKMIIHDSFPSNNQESSHYQKGPSKNICITDENKKNNIIINNFILRKGKNNNNNPDIKIEKSYLNNELKNNIETNLYFQKNNNNYEIIINQKNQEIIKLKKEIKELKEEINSNLIEINIEKEKNKEKENKINILNEEIKSISYINESFYKENEKLIRSIQTLKNKENELLERKKNYNLVIHFPDGNKINFSDKFSEEDTFAVFEEKLYKKYPQYRETNNTFSQSGKIILRFKTLKDNKLENNIQISMEFPQKINNNNIIKKNKTNYNDKIKNNTNININKNDNQFNNINNIQINNVNNMKLGNNNIQNNINMSLPFNNIKDNYEQHMNNFDLGITRIFLEENNIIDDSNK